MWALCTPSPVGIDFPNQQIQSGKCKEFSLGPGVQGG